MDSRPLWKSSRSGKTELLGRPLITAALEYSDYNWRAVVDDRYKLIQNGDGRLELYDYRRDPGERTDIAAENQSIVEKLSRAW
jgi:arylsulfatase A-like enzyme